VDVLHSIVIYGDVEMKMDGHNELEEDQQEDDREEEDEDQDDCKVPRTIGQEEMGNISAYDVDIMVADHTIMLPEQGQEMHQHTPQPKTPQPHTQPQTAETDPLCRQEHLGMVTPQNPCLAVPTVRAAEAAGNTSDMDVNQQLVMESAGGDCLSDVPLPDVHHPDVPYPYIHHPEACLERLSGDE